MRPALDPVSCPLPNGWGPGPLTTGLQVPRSAAPSCDGPRWTAVRKLTTHRGTPGSQQAAWKTTSRKMVLCLESQ